MHVKVYRITWPPLYTDFPRKASKVPQSRMGVVVMEWSIGLWKPLFTFEMRMQDSRSRFL